MKKVGLFYTDFFLKHNTGPEHPERAERLPAIVEALKEQGVWDNMVLIEPEPAVEEDIARLHDPEFISKIKETSASCGDGLKHTDSGDTAVSEHSYDVALSAAGAGLHAAKMVMSGELERAFCLVRPPGHHAEFDVAMGFCLFNNVALTAEYLLSQENDISKVLIVDWDVHHGNGTQHLFEFNPQVLYVSLHQYPFYPATGALWERGRGDGVGATLNVPFPRGTGERKYLKAFDEQIVPAVEKFDPDFILISAGFDAHEDDKTSQINLKTGTYGEMTDRLCKLSEECCGGKIISFLEGGYELKSLADSAVLHIQKIME